MSKTHTSNRAICQGDLDRAGLGHHAATSSEIQREIAIWTTPQLQKFLKMARSETWRKEVKHLLDVRLGVLCDLRVQKAKRDSRRARREKQRQRRREQQSL